MKKSLYTAILGYMFLFIFMACKSPIAEIDEVDPSLISSTPSLVKAIKAENIWLGLSNVGDITIRVKPEKQVLPEKPGKAPDLSTIRKEPGKFRLVSAGGALSAGFRDGGLYREGQLTAFPNLIARQMGIDFTQPLFSQAEGNGTGYKAIADVGGALVSFKMITNNLGVIQRNGETAYSDFADKEKVVIDQLAFPEIQKGLQFFRYPAEGDKSYKFINRIVKDDDKIKYKNPWELIEDQKADLFIFEFGMDDLVQCIKAGGGGISHLFGIYISPSTELGLMRAVGKKSKGIVLNVPDVLYLPYFSQTTNEKISKLDVKLFVETSTDRFRPFDPSIDIITPSATAEKLFKGELAGKVYLKDTEVISEQGGDLEVTDLSPNGYNRNEISVIAKELNWPVVDINSLYKRIQSGGYATDDGVKVSAFWPKGGNFFSADGIYPTAFGQAVIANEVIKTLNSHYGLEIPLLHTRFFLDR